ncbi:hypothetical protein CKO28_18840 [Rhodovibrio sodomensis]|uniref:Uncharacterized protein n=1 Tax=Rhodovibrio sodomensis TaxID=1088 RepID=A0ABS1DHZ0_9PROT|nr:hypothetical protein [Rhodovibrio sodomensis]MBK1670096.1 hypothetical protein [Rhodovibrio sodomensis]
MRFRSSERPGFSYQITDHGLVDPATGMRPRIDWVDHKSRGSAASVELAGRRFEIDFDDNAGNEAWSRLSHEQKAESIVAEVGDLLADDDRRECYGLDPLPAAKPA